MDKHTGKNDKSDFIKASGALQKIAEKEAEELHIPVEAVIQSLNYLIEHRELLSSAEVINVDNREDGIDGISSGFIAEDAGFYIQIRKALIYAALFFISDAVIAYAGLDLNAIMQSLVVEAAVGNFVIPHFILSEKSGEKCIIQEIASKKTDTSPKEIKKSIGRICTRNYACVYRQKGKCKCKTADIEVICETLAEKKALVKSGIYYRYIF